MSKEEDKLCGNNEHSYGTNQRGAVPHMWLEFRNDEEALTHCAEHLKDIAGVVQFGSGVDDRDGPGDSQGNPNGFKAYLEESKNRTGCKQ